MRIKRCGRSKRLPLACLACVVVALVAVAAVGCGQIGSVGDGGTVSSAESPVPTEPVVDTTAAPGDTTATTDDLVGSGSTTTASTEAASVDTMKVIVYYSRDEKICAAARVIPKTQSVGAAAVRALLEGPKAGERDGGMSTCIPEGTTFLGLDIADGIATVDLSLEYGSGGGTLSMTTRLAQVVFTLTQFPSVDGVRFKLDGRSIDVLGGEGIIIDHPMSREDYEDLSPAILVESPTLGETVDSPLRITGTANVFEAVFRLNIVDWDGRIVADKVVTATSGTGTRGTFDVTIPFEVDRAGVGAIIVFAESPKDGSQIDVVEIPLHIEK